MEQILSLYNLPYDPAYPVVCFDERPCFLIGDKVEPLPIQTGKPSKEHYAYEKFGSAALLAAIEPLTGHRIAQLYQRRTKKEYALFCLAIAEAFPNARKIRLIQDNLNTHSKSAFYQYLPADQAFTLAQKFEFYFTPKSASWLNMIELEFSALARLCLNRRIPSFDLLEKEVLAFIKDRHLKQITLNWQFSIPAARDKFQAHYHKVNPLNPVPKEL